MKNKLTVGIKIFIASGMAFLILMLLFLLFNIVIGNTVLAKETFVIIERYVAGSIILIIIGCSLLAIRKIFNKSE